MNDKLIDQIKKILSKTTSNGCTAAEAEAAFAMASRKLAEHNLTLEDVAGHDGPETESWAEEEVHETGRWSLEDNLVYGIIKSHFFCEGFFNRRSGRKVFLLFGKPENVATGRHVWSALHAAFDRQWTNYRYTHNKPASERRLFVSGMAKGFNQKLKDEREAMTIERDLTCSGKGTALALVDIGAKIQAAMKAQNPDLKPKKTNYAAAEGSTSTLQAGIAAGRSLSLNRAVDASKRRAIQ